VQSKKNKKFGTIHFLPKKLNLVIDLEYLKVYLVSASLSNKSFVLMQLITDPELSGFS
jgi:hypothetical protein